MVREEVKRKGDEVEKLSQDSMKEIVRACSGGGTGEWREDWVPFSLVVPKSDIQEAIFRMQQECYARENHYEV